MQTENTTHAETQKDESFLDNLKTGLSTNRARRTIAAIVGAGVGVGITAISPRSNNLTLALTAGFGALEVVSVYKNEFLEDHFNTDMGTLGFIAGAKAVETALFGFVANHVVGDDIPAAEETSDSVIEMADAAQVIVLQPQA